MIPGAVGIQAAQAWLRAQPTWLAVGLIAVATLVLAKAVQVGGDVLIKRVTLRVPGDVDDIVFRAIHPPLYVTVVLVGTYLGLVEIGLLRAISGELLAGLLTILTAMWALTLTRVGRKVSNELTGSDHVDAQVVPIFQNVWSVAILGISIFVILSVWRIDVTPILASAGIIGIVVGLAARDTIANFFGSIALYFDGTYTVGDYIVLESGERGRVEDVSIRSTVIKTRDDVLVTVPNSVLNSARIINESTPSRERRVRLSVGVAYGSDVDAVEQLLLDVAAEEGLVIDRPKPRARLREFGDSSLDFELLCWVSDPVLRGRVVHELNKAIYERFREADVEIPFPQRVVEITSTDAFDAEASPPRVADAPTPDEAE